MNISECIKRYEASGTLSKDAYGALKNTIPEGGCTQDNFLGACGTAEILYCEELGIDYFIAKGIKEPKYTSGKLLGQWKLRTCLPPAYTSAKSVISKALSSGVDVRTIRALGKTALSKETRGTGLPSTSTKLTGKGALKLLRDTNSYLGKTGSSVGEELQDEFQAELDQLLRYLKMIGVAPK